tara:strand:+ start:5189 stop:5680 length:492 start_codon:yes stop_codon:yes gene_type:complete
MSPLAEPPEPGFTIKGWHVAAGVTAFFALVIAADISFTVLAYRTFPGQVAVRPYEDGLVYNARLERLRVQQQLGWRASAEATPRGVEVRMLDREGNPLTGLVLTGLLQRPATERDRKSVTFTETAPGHYFTETGSISGAWDAQFEARDAAGNRFDAERRLYWP